MRNALRNIKYCISRGFLAPGAGVTLIEMCIGVVLALLVLVALHQVFSHYTSASLKGQDTLTSVREALQTLEHIRREAMMATNIASPAPLLSDLAEPIDLSASARELLMLGPEGAISYGLATDARGVMYLERAVTVGTAVNRKTMNLGRVRDFLVYWIVQKQHNGPNQFVTRSLYVQLVLQGTDLRGAPATEVRVGSLISPPFSAFANSTWP